jgi:hypothetical protein
LVHASLNIYRGDQRCSHYDPKFKTQKKDKSLDQKYIGNEEAGKQDQEYLDHCLPKQLSPQYIRYCVLFRGFAEAWRGRDPD